MQYNRIGQMLLAINQSQSKSNIFRKQPINMHNQCQLVMSKVKHGAHQLCINVNVAICRPCAKHRPAHHNLAKVHQILQINHEYQPVMHHSRSSNSSSSNNCNNNINRKCIIQIRVV